jgi:peptidoglycan/xylan/chitin deacetylase (PgdA/CDA1 family)
MRAGLWGAAVALLASGSVLAGTEPAASAPTAAATPASAQGDPHSGAAHTGRIRSAHFNRLQERLSQPPESLREQCRFESELGVLPPVGQVALSFDDGPEPGHTEQIVDVLRRQQVPATFFLIAEKAVRHPALVALIRSLPGVRIGSHSWSHPNFHKIGPDAQRDEIDKADDALSAVWQADPQALTEPPLKLFRYPYGNSSCEGNQRLHERGFHIVGWHIDSCDWAFDGDDRVTAQEALSCGVLPAYRKDFLGHVLATVRAHRGGVVLMHETHRNTVHALEELVKKLKEDAFTFTTPDDPAYRALLR